MKTAIIIGAGFAGSTCADILKNKGFKNLIGKSSSELDLRDYNSVFNFIKKEEPDIIIIAAAVVGGIYINNTQPYNFLLDNLLIQNNIIRSAHELDINKVIFLGSSCIYPKESSIPIKEDYLLNGKLEPTNQWYAIAKIAGLKLIESLEIQHNRNYISLMPTNLYGPNDNFDLKSSHVMPALIRKFHDAKMNKKNSITLWGTGKPLREFLHVDDLASAVLFSLNNKLKHNMYNVGYGSDIKISELAEIIKNITKFDGEIFWDANMPDGTLRKLIDSSRINNLGWYPKIKLKEGITTTYSWFKEKFSKK